MPVDVRTGGPHRHDPDLDRWCASCRADCDAPSVVHAPDCPFVGGLDIADGTERCAGCRNRLAPGEPYLSRRCEVTTSGTVLTEPVCLGCAAEEAT